MFTKIGARDYKENRQPQLPSMSYIYLKFDICLMEKNKAEGNAIPRISMCVNMHVCVHVFIV